MTDKAYIEAEQIIYIAFCDASDAATTGAEWDETFDRYCGDLYSLKQAFGSHPGGRKPKPRP